jgi:hypothetical protein
MSSMLAMDRFWRNNRILRSRVHGMDVREDHDKQKSEYHKPRLHDLNGEMGENTSFWRYPPL